MSCITEFIHQLRLLGVRAGDTLIFEAPHIQPGQPGESFETWFTSLQELVGQSGTAVVPTCTPSEGYPKPIFDPTTSPSEMGSFSEFFRSQPGVLRSHSPTHSVAALGTNAAKLISSHRTATGRPTPWGDGPFGFGSPWDLLYERDAWWVLVDSSLNSSPVTTYVQALYTERHSGVTKRTPFPKINPYRLAEKMTEAGVFQRIETACHTSVIFHTQNAVDCALQILQDQIQELDPDPELTEWLGKLDYIHTYGHVQFGTAKVTITPPVPCLRWDGKPLNGVYRDLFARILVFSHADVQVAFVLCDLLGMSRELVNKIRAEAKDRCGLPPEAVLVSCTHAHSTPDTIGSGFEDPMYLEFMVGAISEGICRAASRLRPVRVGWSKVPIRGIAHSRRKKLVDGTVYTTRYSVPSTWRVKPDLIASEGTIDTDLTVVRIEDLDGKLLAALSNFGCHASVALMSSNVSGDYLGEAMAGLETLLGAEGVALCTNAAAADVDPTLEIPYWGPRNDAMARHLGILFTAQVLEALERIEVSDIGVVSIAQELVELPVREDWFDLIEKEQERMQQEFANGWSLSSVVRQTLRARAIQTEVMALRINDLLLVGFPGEIFTETGMELKAEIPNRAAAVIELANDDIGYIPPRRAFEEGGYEVAQNLWGRVTPDGVDLLLDAARRVIEQLVSPDNLTTGAFVSDRAFLAGSTQPIAGQV